MQNDSHNPSPKLFDTTTVGDALADHEDSQGPGPRLLKQ